MTSFTELNWLLWWIWHTIWLRMIDTPWWHILRHEWSGWWSRGSDIQCQQPPIQTDVKLCLFDHFSFITKALVKPGDMVIWYHRHEHLFTHPSLDTLHMLQIQFFKIGSSVIHPWICPKSNEIDLPIGSHSLFVCIWSHQQLRSRVDFHRSSHLIQYFVKSSFSWEATHWGSLAMLVWSGKILWVFLLSSFTAGT